MGVRIPAAQCLTCLWLKSTFAPMQTDPGASGSHRETCKAFPDGIPDLIASGKHDHRKPFHGDNGILWTPVKSGIEYPYQEE